MRRLKYLLVFLCASGLLNHVQAQEQLLDLQVDPALNNYYRSHQLLWKSKTIEEPMFLPFFDDFNQDDYRPKASLWMGDNVFVNKKFQLFPPDLGVATFDAMDASGNILSNASQYSFPADTLTSQPIRLDSIQDPVLRALFVKDSIYFSFYYQPQGRGNAPEEDDKLTLEFYSPSLDQWYVMWNSKGTTLDSFYVQQGVFFQQVFIPMTDSAKFFHSGFQFRFSNYASLAGNSQPDWQSNCDQWNIDFVWLDRNRSVADSGYRKIAFVNQPPSMIKRYQSMPYRQYRNDPTNSMKDTIHSILIRNLDTSAYTASYSYEISNQTSQESYYDGGSVKIEPFIKSGFPNYKPFSDPRVISFFSIYNEEQKSYTITHIINDIGLTGAGDTAVRVQEFSNYYAYDDGTPEAGYGLSVKNGKAAIQFKLNTKDTLTRIQMYFNPTLTGANELWFNLKVWKSLDPEEEIFSKRVKAQITEGLYNFYTFDLDTNLILANEFYIGFEQLSTENLNVGFDYALNSGEYMYYNIGGDWLPSIFSGSLMMRPLFGVNMPTAIQNVELEKSLFTIYPNPLSGAQLHFKLDDGFINDYEVEIYNLTGQKWMQIPMQPAIDVSSLQNGIYLVRINNLMTGESRTQKLIKRKN